VSMSDAELGALAVACGSITPDIANCLKSLVSIPSVNGIDTEAAVAEQLIAAARDLGLAADTVASDPARPNALVSWGRGPARFVLVGHMDTVATGDPSAWSSPPFAGEIHGGRVIGRGTADNKAGLACGLHTLAVLRDRGILDPDAVQVILAGVVDEESGACSTLGARYLLDQGLLQPARGAIYTYASDFVCVGHRGLLRLVLSARGEAIHSGSGAWARGEAGVNAVTGLADVLLRLEALDVPAPQHPAFAKLRCTLTPGTLFSGGQFESVVPPSAEALVDVRLMPGQTAEQILALVDAAIGEAQTVRPGLSVSVRVKNDLPAAAIPLDHPLAELAQRHAEAVTGVAWPIAGAGPANEGYMLIEAGIPTLAGFGPTGGNAHAPDEWVDVESLGRTVAIYTAIIEDYLGRD